MDIGTVRVVKIEDEMRGSYLDYAMSVIVSRAIPDVRDGLKPVHRRILYAMDELALRPTSPYKKSARIVGEVMGKYHPHGDAPIYDAMVRMAQDFSMRYRLVDGQGNFGSIDDDPPAAMRYTEARLAAMAEEMLADIDKETVNFAPNFDDSLQEPTVLPARVPNLLVNGASGIAVGMATNIPPHNLGEVCDAIARLIDEPDTTVEDLLRIIPGPDFPTGGLILGQEGIKSAYAIGHGRIIMRARAHIEETRVNRSQIIVTELPFQTNKAALIQRIAELVKDRKVDGIADLRDESDRHGLRVVIELKREAQPQQVLNSLYKYTAMQSSFAVNSLVLVDGQPVVVSLKSTLQHYINYRQQILVRRSQFELRQAKERAHILEGLKVALDHLDEVIATIRSSQSAENARSNLMKGFGLTQIQTQAILDMQLRRLAALEQKKIVEEYTQVLQTIASLEDLLANPRKILYLVKEEVKTLKTKYGDARRTIIVQQEAEEFREEDLVPHQDVVVTLSNRGYIKRLLASTYRSQRRGGRGITGVITREAETVQHLLTADTHDSLLFFTDRGRTFQLKCYDIPEVSRQARGLPVVNLISLAQGEAVTALLGVSSFPLDYFLVMATGRGEVKKTSLADFDSIRSSGLIAMDLEAGDELVSVKGAAEGQEVLLITAQGQAIRFPVDELRTASRGSGGVRGIRLEEGDRVVAMEVATPQGDLFMVTAGGFGKRTPFSQFPVHHRGGGGVRCFAVSEAGPVTAAMAVEPSHELVVISAEGLVLRTAADTVSVQGRGARGVSIMKLAPEDRVVAAACLNVQLQEETKPHR
ncbi:MAG: DNA gyrase subunit A [Chloroflexi bacterium]|nr:DNA gyrase subunit A [Chloroflexota bacterium]